MYTYSVMPNKTIYVRDSDLPLFDQAQEQIGESISSLFAEFLRERVAALTPQERTILELRREIAKEREDLKEERGLPDFIDREFAAAEAYAGKSLKSLRAGEIKKAKAHFYAANTYCERARRDLEQTRELDEKLAAMLGEDGK